MTIETPPSPAAEPAPQALRDHRPRATRIATAAVLLATMLALVGFVQSLRDEAIERLERQDVPAQPTGIGAGLAPQPEEQQRGSTWLVFFGISGALIVVGCGITYVTADPLGRRALEARRAADAARGALDAARVRLADERREAMRLEKKIAETVVNASREIWVAEGWSRCDILARVAAHPELFGAWSEPADALYPTAEPPPPGEALGVAPPAGATQEDAAASEEPADRLRRLVERPASPDADLAAAATPNGNHPS